MQNCAVCRFRVIIAEVYANLNGTLAYYGTPDYPIVHFPFNTNLVKFENVAPAKMYDHMISDWLENMPEGAVANWMV